MLLSDFYETLDVVSNDDATIQFTIHINKDHKIFEGHFPNNPITPGVVLLQVLKNCLEQYTNSKLRIQSTSNVKFLHPVNPEKHQQLVYSVQIQNEGGFLKVKNHTSFTDGTSVLKCNITFAKLPQ
ncbi:3-hydroxyacyl-ACP dehydratase [Winogradskyella sp. A3E31]|uniref:3-hydroxyacyl-ACP dehydratase n=1 Tax=Winogradskyella sp. A3E31 TaxID=3349637 RepID=UPI00398AFF9D